MPRAVRPSKWALPLPELRSGGWDAPVELRSPWSNFATPPALPPASFPGYSYLVDSLTTLIHITTFGNSLRYD